MNNKTKLQQDKVMINFDSKVLSFKKRIINSIKVLFGQRIILIGTVDKKETKK